MKEKILLFIKNETVLVVTAILTIISMFIIHPDISYAGYINYSVLAVLFCLMAVVQGFKRLGVLDKASAMLLSKAADLRMTGIILTSLCFFLAMLVTNDVSLLTIVPLTMAMLDKRCSEKYVIFIIVMETIAANLGSMVTPMGNPQNLFLYYHYNMDIGLFLKTVVPYGVVSYIIIIICCVVVLKKIPFTADIDIDADGTHDAVNADAHAGTNIAAADKDKSLFYIRMTLYSILFIICILTVLGICDYRICFAVVLVALVIFDRPVLKKIDYMLLLTFVCFFIFSGNVSKISFIKGFITSFVEGHAFASGLLLSQIISNVPAATMLAGFTEDCTGLMLGVDIGGLGTLVASLASLISYKLYSAGQNRNTALYIKTFTIYNVILLSILCFMTALIR